VTDAVQRTAMNSQEKRSAGSLAAIFGLRMMGLFLILPVFSTYAHGLKGALEHPELVGIALGAYGLSQALLQIPFGMMSDKFGRKPVIAAGMLLFALGSVIAAMSDSIEGVLLGRIIQGSGAVAAAVIALAADLTREEARTKAMAMIGITIGLSFAVSMVLGPLLVQWVGVPGLFWLTGVLALLSILVLYFVVPNPVVTMRHRDSALSFAKIGEILKDRNLLRLDIGVFILHGALTALFVVLPLVLADPALDLLAQPRQWMLYLPVMLLAFVLMIPLIIIAESKRKMKQIFVFSIALLAISCVLLAFSHASLLFIALALLLFFTAFNTLEASLTSLVSKYAPVDAKGTAVGIFNTHQFMGAFAGGVLGGFLYDPHTQNYAMTFMVVAGMFGLWLIIAFGMNQPPYLATRVLHVDITDAHSPEKIEAAIAAVHGVAHVVVVAEENAAYCKVDSKVIDEAELLAVADSFRV